MERLYLRAKPSRNSGSILWHLCNHKYIHRALMSIERSDCYKIAQAIASVDHLDLRGSNLNS